MRVVVQRVSEAQVMVENEIVGKIGRGFLVLLGIQKSDTGKEIPWLAEKLCNLRVFPDEEGKMNRSLLDSGGEVLIVSQFTLYANCQNGRRPDFMQAAAGHRAESLYQAFVEEMRGRLRKVETGRFGASMQVHLINEGPVTVIIDRDNQ